MAPVPSPPEAGTCGAAAGIGLPVMIAVVLVVAMISFALGLRARRLLAALRALLVRARASGDKGESDDDAEKEEEEEATEQQLAEEDVVAHFLSQAETPGMDDHPEVMVNPVMLHNIRRAEVETRERLREEALLARQIREGASDEEVARWREEEIEPESVGSVLSWRPRRWGTATNSSRILVNAGAKFTPIDDARGDEAQAAADLRLKTRNIYAHLERQGIDTTLRDESDVGAGRGLRVTALTKAKETAFKRVGGEEAQRAEERRAFAQRGRWRVATPLLTPRSDWSTTMQRLREVKLNQQARPEVIWGTFRRGSIRRGSVLRASTRRGSVQAAIWRSSSACPGRASSAAVRNSTTDVFGVFDAESKGSIGITELETVMHDLGQEPTQQDLEQMIAQIDIAGTGRIQLDQFARFIEQQRKAEAERRARLDELEC